MISQIKLPFHFDIKKMQSEVMSFNTQDWIPHFNQGYYKGDWSAIPLRSVNGDKTRIFPDPTGTQQLANTIHMENCVYLKQIVDSFLCDKREIRLLKLSSGSNIKEHSDFDLSYEDGEVRLHIPIITNPDMEFLLDRKRVIMNEGECWYLNFNLKHSVANNGATDRVHLVIDCILNEWLDKYFKT